MSLLQLAKGGHFGIGPNAGQALLTAIRRCRHQLNSMHDQFATLRWDIPLGASPHALVVSAFDREVATGPTNSGIAVLGELKTVLAEAEEAVQEAMKHYQRTEDHNVQTITSLGH